jgi:hypothetical protein
MACRSQEGLHVYAHCLRETAGGVVLLAINDSRTQSVSISLPAEADRYVLTAKQLESRSVRLSGQEIRLGSNDELPNLQGSHLQSGAAVLARASITFLTLAGAGNENCR